MSSSFILPLLLQSAVLPLAVALAVLAAARAFGRVEAVTPFAVIGATLATYFAIHDQWSPWPRQALDWLPWIAVLGSALAFIVAAAKSSAARLLLRLAGGALAALLTLAPILGSAGGLRVAGVAAASALLVALVWVPLVRRQQRNNAAALALVVVAGGAGLMLMIDASQSLGQLHGALAMGCAACLLHALLTKRANFGEAAAGTALILLAAMLVNAHVYAGFSLAYVALLVAGLAGAAVPVILRRLQRNHTGAAAYLGTALAAGLPVLVAIGLVLKAAQDSGGY